MDTGFGYFKTRKLRNYCPAAPDSQINEVPTDDTDPATDDLMKWPASTPSICLALEQYINDEHGPRVYALASMQESRHAAATAEKRVIRQELQYQPYVVALFFLPDNARRVSW